jgi:peptidoglycan hydrolase CwlO-like protein
MEAFFQILTNFGFPIALSVYLLLRFEKILEGLQKTITELVTKNTELVARNDRLATVIEVLQKSITNLRSSLKRRNK